jgi:hypothetical protein
MKTLCSLLRGIYNVALGILFLAGAALTTFLWGTVCIYLLSWLGLRGDGNDIGMGHVFVPLGYWMLLFESPFIMAVCYWLGSALTGKRSKS